MNNYKTLFSFSFRHYESSAGEWKPICEEE